MAEKLGRKVTLKINSVAVATARTKNLTINNEMIDITSDGDDGIQRALAEPGQKSVEISVDGLAADATLLDFSLGNNLITELELDYGTYTLTGDFYQSSYTEGLPYNEAITFSATYSSSGAIAKTPVPPPSE